MPRFNFRLQTLFKLRIATRDRCREELAEALKVDRVLEQQLEEIKQTIAQTRHATLEASRPGAIDVDNLLNSHRHVLILETQIQKITNQREQVGVEIERRRLALVEADREIKVLEKLRESQHRQHMAEQEKTEVRQMDEIALRRTLAARKDARS